jgi:hypothetical protein
MWICRPGRILLTLGFCAVAGMNIIKKFKQHWEQAKSSRHKTEAQSNICTIPVSHLNGIATLPTELWSLILSHVVIDHLAHPYYKSLDFPFILSYRLVCRPSLPSLPPSLLAIQEPAANNAQTSSTRKPPAACTATSTFHKSRIYL